MCYQKRRCSIRAILVNAHHRFSWREAGLRESFTLMDFMSKLSILDAMNGNDTFGLILLLSKRLGWIASPEYLYGSYLTYMSRCHLSQDTQSQL
jgi:hypothetical protein